MEHTTPLSRAYSPGRRDRLAGLVRGGHTVAATALNIADHRKDFPMPEARAAIYCPKA